ncbi:hypothetical protein ACQP2F_24075 [Actinoplanes sp. CA-030573]|uniref:hypothetical protein n=1 Tax=Actinoplanes sp. CA-030573 TaxID=3239898 RepID=UPI003D8E0FF5
MSTEVRVGVIAGIAQLLAAMLGLFGVLATAGKPDAGDAARAPAASVSATPVAASSASSPVGAPCTDVIDRYRRLVANNPALVTALDTAGPDGLSPLRADADARRCGISAAMLRTLR